MCPGRKNIYDYNTQQAGKSCTSKCNKENTLVIDNLSDRTKSCECNKIATVT